MLKVRSFFFLMLCVLPVSIQAAPATDSYPSKPVRLIVPYSAGGDTDTLSRLIAHKLGESLGQTVVVENRAGANGIVGSKLLVDSPADGYTLLVSPMGILTINQFLYDLPFDPVNDVAPISMLVRFPTALVANPSVPFKDVKGLVDAAKAHPGKFNVGSGSSTFQLFLELLKEHANINLQHVSYKGGSPATTDLLGGHVEMLITGLSSIIPLAKEGKLNIIAITNSARTASMPDVPTFNETLPGLELNNWNGLFAPAGTPQAIIEKLNKEITHILSAPDVQKELLDLGAEIAPSTASELETTMKNDAERWSRLIKTTGMRAE